MQYGKASQHTEWLFMVEKSGPFLALPVLEKRFPQGLDAIETSKRKYAREVYEYRCDAIDENHPEAVELNRGWIRIVLMEILDFDDSALITINGDETSAYVYSSPDGKGVFAPDFVLSSEAGKEPFLFVSVLPPGTDLEKVKIGDGWPVPIAERMKLLCRDSGVRLGLVTDGERWMLVNAPVGSTSGHASWYSRLWFQEPVTFQAFKSLFEIRRWFGPDDETLPSMLEESLEHHEEVTDTLGEQVKRAVEVLVQCLDKADQDRNGDLLNDVEGSELYEAGLTVMMRLVFVLCAEERGLMLLNEPIYDQHYAITTLRGQLAEEAGQHGPEVLERRHDAWARLLAVFRAIYGGVEHEALRMPALGGSLFDPDRFPFLEGRGKETCWQDTPAQPLPIDNRTVLLLLNALQVLKQRGDALLLSYKALDVEQIGHVYEGLLEHTVKRLPNDTLGLVGSRKAKNPNVSLSELESAYLDGVDEAVNLVKDITERGLSAIKKALKKDVNEETFGKVLAVCGGDTELANRIRPFSHLLRTDAWGDFIVYHSGSFAVTLGADRRETGTHYTPKSLTENIVETTLEPIVYIGPAEGAPREQWQLKSSAELLDLKICDPAMGSGAFLVQVCRWLSERLVESWGNEITAGKFITVDGIALEEADGAEPMSDSLDDRLLIARRLVAEKCLYGVDMNPLAVELAKLSIWLVTLAKGRPFGFLDHNLRSGDSLIGLHKLEQLTKFSLQPAKKQTVSLFASNIEAAAKDVLALRKKLRETSIRDIRDVQYMERLDQEARQKLEHIEHIADAMIGEALAAGGNKRKLETAMDSLSTWAVAYIEGDNETGRKIITEARKSLSINLPAGKPPRKPFHWALEFPEVFERGGFDGIVGNPPFLGGVRISETNGEVYNVLLTSQYSSTSRKTDLCAYFFRRAAELLRKTCLFGFLATNTISQGTTRKGGLTVLLMKGFNIIQANPSFKWPGQASVIASQVTITNGEWLGKRFVSGEECNYISDLLTSEVSKNTTSYALFENGQLCFQGSSILGMGFFLTPTEANSMLSIQNNMRDVVKPVMGGKELNTSPDYAPPRWIIDMFERTENEASEYNAAFKHLEIHVKPERQKKDSIKYPRLVITWWKFWHSRGKLYGGIKRLDLNRVLVRARVSDHHMMAFLPAGYVYTEQLAVFLLDKWTDFSILQSSLHECWLRQYASTLKNDVRYIPTDCFGTFPFPRKTAPLYEIGEKYYEQRSAAMTASNNGMTKVYNQFHSPQEISDGIQKLRDLHIEMDTAVAAAYGWDDLDLDHDFHETKQGTRFTISEEARREVLQRLLKLNHERYEEEVKQGLHDKKMKISKPSKKKKNLTKNNVQLEIFGE